MKIYRPCRFAAALLKSRSRGNAVFISKLSAFTLIELLVVIAILGILAGLAVPALKNIGKGDAALSASRQMLDDIGYARQLAMSQHTTVYMVFVPTNFWDVGESPGNLNSAWLDSLSPDAKTAATNLCDKQLTGYTFMADGAIGDQPGKHTWHYLSSWKNLPEGTFIAQQKFNPPTAAAFHISQWDSDYHNSPPNPAVPIYGFATTNDFPFPTETNTVATMPSTTTLPLLPYIAFNYLGQLTFDGQTLADRDEYIPLAKGGVSPAIDPTTKAFLMNNSPDISEIPPGNSTNISYNVIHIDALTGRAILEYYKMKP